MKKQKLIYIECMHATKSTAIILCTKLTVKIKILQVALTISMHVHFGNLFVCCLERDLHHFKCTRCTSIIIMDSQIDS